MARYLFSDRKKAEKELKDKFIYLFLDYDGTLAPITEIPSRAFMSKNTRRILRRLSETQNCKLVIVSGRKLTDVRKKVGLKGIVYAGNHGFEIKGPKIAFKSPVPMKYRKILEEIKVRFGKWIFDIKGLSLEDKGFSLSLHYRLVDKKEISRVKAEFYTTMIMYEVKHGIRVRQGKKIFEIRPPTDWDKGKVVLWLLAREKFALNKKNRQILPIYIGDDATDEDAFEALRGKGMTIFVGKPGKTKAEYFINNTKETVNFLNLIFKTTAKNI